MQNWPRYSTLKFFQFFASCDLELQPFAVKTTALWGKIVAPSGVKDNIMLGMG